MSNPALHEIVKLLAAHAVEEFLRADEGERLEDGGQGND